MAQTQDPTRVRRDDVAAVGFSKTKDKRSSEEKQRDLTILADIYYRNPNQDHYALTQKFNEVTGRTLIRSTISRDLRKIKKAALEGMIEDMQIVVAEELLKLEQMEKALWKIFYDAQDNVKKRIIDKVVRENDDGEMEEIVRGIRVIEEFSGDFSIKTLDKIMDLQKERRKILGVYAYSALEVEREIDTEKKGYVKVSPEDWDNRSEEDKA